MVLFLVQPFNLAAMSDLRSGVLSQNQDILHISGVSKIVFFTKPHKWKKNEEVDSGDVTLWTIAAQKLSK